jgi:hypothetical protein
MTDQLRSACCKHLRSKRVDPVKLAEEVLLVLFVVA